MAWLACLLPRWDGRCGCGVGRAAGRSSSASDGVKTPSLRRASWVELQAFV